MVTGNQKHKRKLNKIYLYGNETPIPLVQAKQRVRNQKSSYEQEWLIIFASNYNTQDNYVKRFSYVEKHQK